MCRATHISLSLKGGHDPAGGALVQAQLSSQRIQRGWSAAEESVESVTLGQRDIVAADLISLTQDVPLHEIRQCLVKGLDLLLEGLVCFTHSSWHNQLYVLVASHVKLEILKYLDLGALGIPAQQRIQPFLPPASGGPRSPAGAKGDNLLRDQEAICPRRLLCHGVLAPRA